MLRDSLLEAFDPSTYPLCSAQGMLSSLKDQTLSPEISRIDQLREFGLALRHLQSNQVDYFETRLARSGIAKYFPRISQVAISNLILERKPKTVIDALDVIGRAACEGHQVAKLSMNSFAV
jgi:hypothetical protein